MNTIVDGKEDDGDAALSGLFTAATDGRHKKCTCAVFEENCAVVLVIAA